MDNGTDSLLDTYLFETNSLLERLDELLIDAEQNKDFTDDEVNEIFRSMHTIKGSSAMLEFNSLMEIAHHIEDLFFYIRENGMSTLNSDQKSELFNLMFKSVDRLREEVEKVESNEPLSTNIDSFIEEINNFLGKISNQTPSSPGTDDNAETAGAANAKGSLPVSDMPWYLRVFFEDGCGMENLRAFMLLATLRENGYDFTAFPENVETDSSTSQQIIANGFYIGFKDEEQAKKAEALMEVPIGCVIVYQDKIIARGYNRRNTDKNTLSHAELNAIRKASKKLGDWRLEGCTMYVTLEPCQMCAGALVQARIDEVVIGSRNPKAGCAGSVMNLLNVEQFNHQVKITEGVLEEECSAMLSGFFRKLREMKKRQKAEKD